MYFLLRSVNHKLEIGCFGDFLAIDRSNSPGTIDEVKIIFAEHHQRAVIGPLHAEEIVVAYFVEFELLNIVQCQCHSHFVGCIRAKTQRGDQFRCTYHFTTGRYGVGAVDYIATVITVNFHIVGGV